MKTTGAVSVAARGERRAAPAGAKPGPGMASARRNATAAATLRVGGAAVQRMVILPARGLRATPLTARGGGGTATAAAGLETLLRATGSTFLRALDDARVRGQMATAKNVPTLAATPGLSMRVLDSVAEDGAKLVEMSPDALSALRAAEPGLRVVPLRFYRPQSQRLKLLSDLNRVAASGGGITVTLTVVSKSDGSPVGGATVVAFTDFAQRVGDGGTTSANGRVRLRLGSSRVQRLYVYAPLNSWNGFKKNFKATAAMRVELEPLDLGFVDSLRHHYGTADLADGRGVTVGVIDTGVGPHPDLAVDGGLNTVLGEPATDFADGDQHGSHVAGIIASRGAAPSGVRGIAPGVRLRAYRVFGRNAGGASNFDIAKAIDAASLDDECDLINLSLGSEFDPDFPDLTPEDELLRAAIEDARALGTLAIAAAGNDDRSPVNLPGRDALCVAVSALGRKGTFPKSSTEPADVAAPFGADQKDFIAAFSNVGAEVDLTGPGVGVISTVPGGHLPMSGTSMACPAVTGVAARLLAKRADILAMARDAARANATAQALLQSAKSLGFAPRFQGRGLPRLS
jgi:subtilisin